MDISLVEKINKDLDKIDGATEVIKGLLGGILIGICAIMTIKVNALNLTYGFLINSLLFPTGIILCNLCGGTLFTGNCINFMGDNLNHALQKVLLSLIGNVLGMGIICIFSILFLKGYSLIGITLSKDYLFVSGIFCNVLITIATYIAKISKNNLEIIFGMLFPVCLFVLCGFHHGVVMVFYNLFSAMSLTSLLTVVVGNIVGGFLISRLIRVCKY